MSNLNFDNWLNNSTALGYKNDKSPTKSELNEIETTSKDFKEKNKENVIDDYDDNNTSSINKAKQRLFEKIKIYEQELEENKETINSLKLKIESQKDEIRQLKNQSDNVKYCHNIIRKVSMKKKNLKLNI